MSRTTLSVGLLLFTLASSLDESMWGPSDSVHALDAVVAAVDKVVKNPHLSPERLAEAKRVAEDVKGDVEAVENGKLTKAQAHEKVGAAIKELTAFEANLTKVSSGLDKIAMLKKQLAEKKAELAKDENLMKLFKLKKELAEKKLMLQKLINQKADSENSNKADQEEVAKTSAMVKDLVAMAKNLRGGNSKQELPAPLKAVLATVQARDHAVSDALAKIDAEQKKSEASLDAAMQKQMPTKGKGDALAKGQSMLKLLKTQERRQFAKARALKQIELKELKDAEASIEKGDITGLLKVLVKIQQESQKLQAKSGNFLY